MKDYDPYGGNRIFTAGSATIALMPESFIQMMLEIRNNHEGLWAIVQEKADVPEILAEVGAYLGLEMEGMYSISTTCEDFWKLLRQTGSTIILPIGAGSIVH